MEYRRSREGTTWHWQKQCKKWPALAYENKYTKPTVGQFCKSCEQIELKLIKNESS